RWLRSTLRNDLAYYGFERWPDIVSVNTTSSVAVVWLGGEAAIGRRRRQGR
ncbi:hypothetical protein TorRG33x02_045650, partial [Trema orientale]